MSGTRLKGHGSVAKRKSEYFVLNVSSMEAAYSESERHHPSGRPMRPSKRIGEGTWLGSLNQSFSRLVYGGQQPSASLSGLGQQTRSKGRYETEKAMGIEEITPIFAAGRVCAASFFDLIQLYFHENPTGTCLTYYYYSIARMRLVGIECARPVCVMHPSMLCLVCTCL